MMGKSIFLTGWLSAIRTLELVKENYDKLRETYSRDYLDVKYRELEAVNLMNVQTFAQEAAILPAKPRWTMPDNEAICLELGADGLYGGLWKLGEMLGTGLVVFHEKIQIKQLTIEMGEFFDFDPFSMDATGNTLLVANSPWEQGEMVTWIGQLQENSDRVILNGERKRFLTPPK